MGEFFGFNKSYWFMYVAYNIFNTSDTTLSDDYFCWMHRKWPNSCEICSGYGLALLCVYLSRKRELQEGDRVRRGEVGSSKPSHHVTSQDVWTQGWWHRTPRLEPFYRTWPKSEDFLVRKTQNQQTMCRFLLRVGEVVQKCQMRCQLSSWGICRGNICRTHKSSLVSSV